MTFKRKSIDLVIDRGDVGVLVELKEWKGDTPLYAALELVENFMLFLLAREKDRVSPPIDEEATPCPVEWWPKWRMFDLYVMAPEGFFDGNADNIFRSLDNGLQKWVAADHVKLQRLGCHSVRLRIKELDIKQNEFRKFVEDNGSLLTMPGADRSKLLNSEFLRLDI